MPTIESIFARRGMARLSRQRRNRRAVAGMGEEPRLEAGRGPREAGGSEDQEHHPGQHGQEQPGDADDEENATESKVQGPSEPAPDSRAFWLECRQFVQGRSNLRRFAAGCLEWRAFVQ